MLNTLTKILIFGTEWKDMEIKIEKLKKSICNHEYDIDEDNEFALKLLPHITILSEKLTELYLELKECLHEENLEAIQTTLKNLNFRMKTVDNAYYNLWNLHNIQSR
jgi:chromosome segregation ATPase